MNYLEQLYEDVQTHPFLTFLNNSKKLALYGAGRMCEWLMECAKPYHLPIELIVDAEKEKELDGIPVVRADKFFESEAYKDYKFLITSSQYIYTIGYELINRGIDINDIYAPEHQIIVNGCYRFQEFLYAHVYFSPLDLMVNKKHYTNVYDRLMDERSKRAYVAILKYRIYGDYDLDKELYAPDISYFHKEYITLGKNECFVDVGAYTGDSIIDFLMRTGRQYEKIYAIEGNRNCCESIKKKLYMEYETGKMEIFNVGAGNARETINYSGFRGGVGSDKLEVYTIDELLKDKKVSVIKMDIEGMEMQALEGAKEIIKKQKPRLVICIYHLVRDIWEIPEKIIELVPEYKITLQQPVNIFMEETVLYASVD